jgi:polysaccharide deacetylase
MWIVVVIGVGIMALVHTAPAPFVLDAMAGDRAVWHMPPAAVPMVYLTYDDGPNPTTTPHLLDVLAREGVHATFFLIDRHVTDETAPIVRRMFAEGHAVALHSPSRKYMVSSPSALAATLTGWADRIASLGGLTPVPGIPAARRMARRSDVRGPARDRLPAGWMELDVVGLRLGPAAHRRSHRCANRAARGSRRHHRDA